MMPVFFAVCCGTGLNICRYEPNGIQIRITLLCEKITRESGLIVIIVFFFLYPSLPEKVLILFVPFRIVFHCATLAYVYEKVNESKC